MKNLTIKILILAIFSSLFLFGCGNKTDNPPQLSDGTYNVEVSSSSSMFRIINADLTVENGAMTAVLTLSGTGYLKLFMGTGEEALASTDDDCVFYVEDSEGKYTYEIPIETLDQEFDCAAWSIRKEKWYDRILVVDSTTIPEDAWK